MEKDSLIEFSANEHNEMLNYLNQKNIVTYRKSLLKLKKNREDNISKRIKNLEDTIFKSLSNLIPENEIKSELEYKLKNKKLKHRAENEILRITLNENSRKYVNRIISSTRKNSKELNEIVKLECQYYSLSSITSIIQPESFISSRTKPGIILTDLLEDIGSYLGIISTIQEITYKFIGSYYGMDLDKRFNYKKFEKILEEKNPDLLEIINKTINFKDSKFGSNIKNLRNEFTHNILEYSLSSGISIKDEINNNNNNNLNKEKVLGLYLSKLNSNWDEKTMSDFEKYENSFPIYDELDFIGNRFFAGIEHIFANIGNIWSMEEFRKDWILKQHSYASSIIDLNYRFNKNL